MIEGLSPDLQANEAFKDFNSIDDLAKAHLETRTKITTGDLSILPEEIRKDPSVAKYKNVIELAKGYTEANKLIGTIKHSPSKPEEYKFTSLQNLHKGLANVEGTQKFIANLAHTLDIDNDRADKLQQGILMGLNNALTKQDEMRATKSKEVETALRSEWAGDYDKNKNNIDTILKRLGANDLATSVANDPVGLKAVGKIVSLLSEDSIAKLGDNMSSSVDTKTKEGALKRIAEIQKETGLQKAAHPLFDSKSPKHEEAKKEWTDLHGIAYGN